jgi:four helix bundle protein
MATITKFEDLDAWQMARELNISIMPLLNKLNDSKSFELKSQLDRSAGSVMDNIAEGFERDGNKEFGQFLAISKGSLGEVRSQLFRALDRKYIEQEKHDNLQKECILLAAKLGSFISYLKNSGLKEINSKPKLYLQY